MTPTNTDTPKEKQPLPSRVSGSEAAKSSAPATLPLDLATLSDEVLATFAAEAPREVQRRKDKREQEFFASVTEGARVLNIAPARLAAALRAKEAAAGANGVLDGRSFVRPKYWNVKDHAQRWSGRGAQPRWYAEHLAAGGTEEECVIPEGAL